MGKVAHQPMRTCVGCRERFPQAELIRLRLAGGKIVLDQAHSKLEGRSIYLCPSESCWERALKRGSFTFKSAKQNRLVVYLTDKQKDALIMSFRIYLRKKGLKVNG